VAHISPPTCFRVRCGRTLGLMVGVGVLSLLIGTGTAWLPGRSVLQWLLLLPLAVPTYIIAHSYLELLDYSGIVQTSLRELFGWQNARSLAHDALVHLATGLAYEFWDAALNSLLLAVSAAIWLSASPWCSRMRGGRRVRS